MILYKIKILRFRVLYNESDMLQIKKSKKVYCFSRFNMKKNL